MRISTVEVSGEYLVAQVQPRSLVLRSNPASTTFDVPTMTLERLEVSDGRISRIGALLTGALGGGVLGTAVAVPCVTGGHFSCRSVPATQRVLIGAGVGALVGFAAWGGRELWREVRLPGQSAPQSGDRLATAPGPPRITREQIAASTQWNAAEIIQQIRPAWLRPRVRATLRTAEVTAGLLGSDGQGPIPDPAIYPEVFEDELHFGPIDTLERFAAGEIEAIEFLSPNEATILYGTGYMGGIIRVITRR